MKKLLLFITTILLLGITNVYATQPASRIESITYTFDVPVAGQKIEKVTNCTATPSNSIKSCEGIWIVSDPNGSVGDITGYSEATGLFLEDTTYYLLPLTQTKSNYILDYDNPNIYKFNGVEGTQSITIANNYFSYSLNIYKVKISKNDSKPLTISNIDIVDKSEKAESNKELTYKGLNANLNARFHNINDYIKFEITVLNQTSNFVKLDKNDIKLPKSEYVTYSFEMDDKAINPNSSKKIYVKMQYTNKTSIPENSCNNYIENKSTAIAYRDNIVENPKTSNYVLIALLLVIVLIIAVLIETKTKNKNIQLFTILLSLSIVGIIPLSTIASNNELKINTNVEIDNNQCVVKVNGECVRTEANIKWNKWYNDHMDLFTSSSIDPECSLAIPDVLTYDDGTVTFADGNGNTLVKPQEYSIVKRCPMPVQ